MICGKTIGLKNLDHYHKYSNTVNKKAVAIIGYSILSGIDQYGLSKNSFKVRVKNHPGLTAEDICDHLKPEIRDKPDAVIIHAVTNDLKSNTKSLENHKRMADSVRSKLRNYKVAKSNAITSKYKNEIEKKIQGIQY